MWDVTDPFPSNWMNINVGHNSHWLKTLVHLPRKKKELGNAGSKKKCPSSNFISLTYRTCATSKRFVVMSLCIHI